MDIETNTKEALEELLTATQILANEGVIDGFGHVSVRSPSKPDHYYMITNNSVRPFQEEDFIELDLESNPVLTGDQRPSIERFIHGEIYRARRDVKAIVHTHSPALIPFGVSNAPLRPLYHMCGFLEAGVPVFDIEREHGMTNMLVTSHKLGQSLVRSLDRSALVLMRGHGATIVGSSVKEVVFRAVYTTINARLQPIAMQMGSPKSLAAEEAAMADELHQAVLDRPWDYWKKKIENLS